MSNPGFGTPWVPDWLARRAALSPAKIALRDAERDDAALTYAAWNAQVNQSARFLSEAVNFKHGDHLAILSKNCIAYLDLWFSMAKVGGVLQNLNWRLTAQELIPLLAPEPPRALAYDPSFADTVEELRDTLPGSIHWISLGDRLRESDLELRQRTACPDGPLPNIKLDPEDSWLICYTGGTTGHAKGALLSYRAVTANAINTITSWGLSSEDTTILNAPLFHTGGLNVFTAPLIYLGGTSIVCREFDIDQTLDYLESGSVTVFFGVPTMFIMMQNHPRWEAASFEHLRFIISGGAPCPQPVFERFWAKGVDFKTGYGLTEAGPNTFWLPAEQVQNKPGAVGYPLLNVDLKVVDERDKLCPANTVGQLVIRGPHLFSGYWRDQAATRAAVRDGWLYTGDLAMCDEDGAYTIMGRLKEMIISGGENIYPAEVENILHAHAGVAEAAIIPMPDEIWGEVGWAVVVLRPDWHLDDDELIQFCKHRISGYKVPKRIIFAEELPKTGANKIDKLRLIEKYANQ